MHLPAGENGNGRHFVIDPSVDFDFVGQAQLPDLVFDLFQLR
jgi:hypothetical protein